MPEKLERQLAEFSLDAFSKAEYYCWKADRDFQSADNDYEYLKEHGKDLLASIMTRVKEAATEKVSESALDRLARSDVEWQAHREGEHAARKKKNELRFKSRSAQLYWSTIQSGLSYKKAEMSKIGGHDT